jgi:ADP-ribose pyrophosphatase
MTKAAKKSPPKKASGKKTVDAAKSAATKRNGAHKVDAKKAEAKKAGPKRAGSKSASAADQSGDSGVPGMGIGTPPVSRTEIIDTKKLTNEKWLNLFARTVRRDGKDHRWLFASRKAEPKLDGRPDAVLIVPILLGGPEPLLVATREWRVPIGGYEWGVPAGLLDGDESPEEAARRELWEETGYEIVEVSRVSPLNYSSTGMTDECVQMVYCTCKKPKGHKQHLDGAEEIEVRLLTIDDVHQLVDSDEPVNARAWLTFYMYHRLGKLE